MKIDAHQHFWRYTPEEYGWISSGMEILRQDRLPGDLSPLLDSAGIGGTVAIQARQTLAETEWLLDLAERHPFIHGVVGWVDLCGDDLRGRLERYSGDPKFRGVRHVVQDEPDDEFMLREDFLRGLRLLAEYGLTYDILIFPRHLAVARDVVARFPEQRFVLDHIAKPLIKEAVIEPWATGILHLAAFPHVFCKLSGLVTEADWGQWRVSDFWPYLDAVVGAFSPSRIMFGSDWPVCTLAGGYADVVGIVSGYVERLSPDEQADIWGGTARRFYGLG